jgi:hypothetical protein
MLNVLTPEASKIIFGNIEQLIPISEDLVSSFSALNLSHHESICVGKIFLDVVSLRPNTILIYWFVRHLLTINIDAVAEAHAVHVVLSKSKRSQREISTRNQTEQIVPKILRRQQDDH